MERSISTVGHQKRSPKLSKATKLQQPMKVVYITNPMKFKASASEFRALVQELTGKDSDIADNMSKYGSNVDSASSSTTDHGDHNHQVFDKLANSAGLDHQGAVQNPLEVFDAAFESFPCFMSTFADLHHDAFGNR